MKFIESKAAAAEFARKNKIGLDEQNQWGRFRVEIEARKGQWLDEKFPKGKKKGEKRIKSRDTTLFDEGLTKDESANARLIYNEPEATEKAISDIIDSGKVVTPSLVSASIRKEKQANKVYVKKDLPSGTFEIVYCDPPWQYDTATDNRKIENQYPTMSLENICNMELPTIADNALLLIWSTAPMLPKALKVIEAWGFTYKANCIWDKQTIGMGYWFRVQHEILIIATRGTFNAPLPKNRTSSVYREKRGKHSAKPQYYYQWIEKCFPDRTMIELFARDKHNDKWEVWGNEIL